MTERVEELLGTDSANPKIHWEYIASKAPDALSLEQEVEAIGVDGVAEKSMTVFPRDESGNPILFDYQIKGFFKDATGVLRKVTGTKASKVKAYKKAMGVRFMRREDGTVVFMVPPDDNGGNIDAEGSP